MFPVYTVNTQTSAHMVLLFHTPPPPPQPFHLAPISPAFELNKQPGQPGCDKNGRISNELKEQCEEILWSNLVE